MLSAPLTPPTLLGHAFGLDIHSEFPLDGVSGTAGGGTRAVELKLAPAEVLDRGWRTPEAAETFRRNHPGGRAYMSIHHRPGIGYRVWFSGAGRYVLSEDGRTIRCAPPRHGRERWSLLYSQALPIAAALQGIEVLHASAIVTAGAAFVFVAESGVGKTSLALALVAAGAGFLADDVTAVDPDGERLLVHPGLAVANVPGVPGGSAGGKRSASVPRLDGAVPLGGLYLLERGAGAQPEFDRVAAPGPRELLSSTFVFHVATPGRMIAQLDTCARIAREAPVYRLRCPDTLDLGRAADAVLAHAHSLR